MTFVLTTVLSQAPMLANSSTLKARYASEPSFVQFCEENKIDVGSINWDKVLAAVKKLVELAAEILPLILPLIAGKATAINWAVVIQKIIELVLLVINGITPAPTPDPTPVV